MCKSAKSKKKNLISLGVDKLYFPSEKETTLNARVSVDLSFHRKNS